MRSEPGREPDVPLCDMYENRVTGECAVVLRGSEERPDGPGLVHLIARPGSAVVGEHLHRNITERFKVIRRTWRPRSMARRSG